MSEFVTSRVILYKNGIGHFERKGVVDKEATVELFFPADVMNDILKSINITSAKANERHTITYEVPTISTPSSTPLSPLATHQDLYRRLVRENVTVETAGEKIEGMVVAVDSDRDAKESGKISLLTKENVLRTVALRDVKGLHMPNNSLVSQSKTLKIHVSTQERQEVVVNYIRSCPVWKPTYRAVLSGSSTTDYKLYGWATIHNPGPDDWKGVSVSLVAGQPVSFVSHIYKPKYRKRPTLHSSDTHSPLGISNLLVSALLNESDTSDDEDSRTDDDMRKSKKIVARKRDRSRSYSRSASRSDSDRSRSPAGERRDADMEMREREDVVTVDSDHSDLFRYDLTSLIDLPNGNSALVPIFDKLVSGRKVALYRLALHREHPFSSLVIVNNTGLTLEAGPITVFDGDMYIGEAHLMATKPNERRFLPFAMELGVVVAQLPVKTEELPVHHVTINNMTVSLAHKSVVHHHYTITNKSEKETEFLLEHAKTLYLGTSTLVVEDCYFGEKEKAKVDLRTEYVTNSVYGLNFKLRPNGITHVLLTTQSVVTKTFALAGFDHSLAKATNNPKLMEVIKPYWDLKKEAEELDKKLRKEKERITELEKEQQRARSNLSAIQEREKQKRYLDQIDEIEDKLSNTHKSIRTLQEQIHDINKRVSSVGSHLSFDSLAK
jgi:uncharacterized protein YukE